MKRTTVTRTAYYQNSLLPEQLLPEQLITRTAYYQKTLYQYIVLSGSTYTGHAYLNIAQNILVSFYSNSQGGCGTQNLVLVSEPVHFVSDWPELFISWLIFQFFAAFPYSKFGRFSILFFTHFSTNVSLISKGFKIAERKTYIYFSIFVRTGKQKLTVGTEDKYISIFVILY